MNVSNCHYLCKMPNELFLLSTVGEINKLPLHAIDILHGLRLVCSPLQKKVNECWLAFIHHVGNRLWLMDPLTVSKEVKNDGFDAALFLKERYPILKNWINATPIVHHNQHHLTGKLVLSTANKSIGGQQLWETISPNDILAYDLMTKSTITIKLKESITHCIKRIFSFGKYILIHSGNKLIDLIYIIEIETGNCFLQIKRELINFGKDHEFLYVITKNQGQFVLLKYDSKNWSLAPQEQNIPEFKTIANFLVSSNTLWIYGYNKDQGLLLAIDKSDPANRATESLDCSIGKWPLYKVIDGRLFAIKTSNVSDALLSEASIEDGRIVWHPLGQYCVGEHISDFYMHQERIYIQFMKFELTHFKDFLECFDIASGKQLKIFPLPDGCLFSHMATFFIPVLDRIQLLYQLYVNNQSQTHIMTLDFRLKKY